MSNNLNLCLNNQDCSKCNCIYSICLFGLWAHIISGTNKRTYFKKENPKITVLLIPRKHIAKITTFLNPGD